MHHPRLLLTGGTIHTLDPRRPRASGLAVEEGRIVALDPTDTGGQRIELHGRTVLPGFIDAHLHLVSWAVARQEVDLESTTCLADAQAILRRAAENLPPDMWLRGRGWDRNRWGYLPTAADLDAATGAQRAAVLNSHDGHALWLNTAALRQVGLTAATPDPPGGALERDSHGNPSGVVFENARSLVWDRMPAPSVGSLADALRAALPLAAAAGLTGVHSFEDARALEAVQWLDTAGELTVRVWHGVPRGQLRQAQELGLRTGVGSELMQIGPVKLYADGALGSRTAFMLEPYQGRSDGYRGLPTLEFEELADDLRVAGEAGLDVAVHAIGDAAVRRVLDAVEATAGVRPPQQMVRIEHAQLVQPDDVPRFAALGVIASMQPSHATTDWHAADTHWGDRARHGYAWRTLLSAGAHLAFGTDAPVEPIAPLPSLYAAVTRQDAHGEPPGGWYPEQRLNLLEAIRAYTLGAAFAGRADHVRGSLSVGKQADLVVLSSDPFEAEPSALLGDVQVELTMVSGHVVYQR